ncbi:MAG: hypothetical protein ACLPXB_16155 [Thiobacillaceae bacterium]
MRFLFMLDQQEHVSELAVQGFRTVSHHRKAAAFLRPIFAKGGNDHMPTGAH